ncbi:universal stress protein [Streptomyces sp. SCSIO 30461]|uniref:universal stress protein n=1 Tax=Streptomyces sp. SCSIO 30461 TaxID=3118085 RepID=UPI0030D5C0EA
MTQPVTVGVDGSPESRAATEWAAGEAVLREAPLRLVNVEERWPTVPGAMPPVDPDGYRRWSESFLEEHAGELRKGRPGLEVSVCRRVGRPAAALAIEADDAQLLVLGSRGRGRMEQFFVGSVGTATIGLTDTPVVLIRALDQSAAEELNRDVVVGVDIHETSDEILAFAFSEAARRGCGVRAVHGWTLPFALGYAPQLDHGVQLEVAEAIAAALAERLRPWQRTYPSVKAEGKALVGAPAEKLLSEAADAGIVVVGRRIRRSPVGGHLGHVAHAVLHHVTAPIAVIAHD